MVRFDFRNRVVLVSIVLLSAGAATVSADIVFTGAQLWTYAQDGAQSSAAKSVNEGVPTLPFIYTRQVVDYESTAETAYDFQASGDSGVFDFGFDALRAGAQNSNAGSWGYLDFTVDSDVPYELSGAYALGGTGLIEQNVYLRDLTSGAWLFYQLQKSSNTPNESFTLGVQTGESGSVLGSLTGTLTANSTYKLYYSQYVGQVAGQSASATGLGSLKLKIQPIPAPTAVALGALGLGAACAVGGVRRRLG